MPGGDYSKVDFLLVEPVAKTPYPPLGLMKISTMLKSNYRGCRVFAQVGNDIPRGFTNPSSIYITSLFTWDLDKIVDSILYFQRRFPAAKIKVGGIAASLLPDYISSKTGVMPHIGLLKSAEIYPPDYSLNFGRKISSSITFTTRGCIRNCKFCNVKTHEPTFFIKTNWKKDISLNLPAITFWDNNWLASSNFESDCEILRKMGKRVDFNQGLDTRLYDEEKARMLSGINLDPIRFAFDNIKYEKDTLRAIKLSKKYSNKEIRFYVLYNFDDTPEDFFYRIDLLNREKVFAFPMEYRSPDPGKIKFPGPYWNTSLLRALKLSLLFYYKKGMITKSRNSFISIYGKNPKQFIKKLYEIYKYDKTLRKS